MKISLIALLMFLILTLNIFAVSGVETNDKFLKSNFFDSSDYIIITSRNFKNYVGENSFHDLCDYHSNQGLNTKIETIESIDRRYNGYDLQEEIRDYIGDEKPKYVLLAGDNDILPARNLLCKWSEDCRLKPAPSDLYYSCPDVTWHKEPEKFKPSDRDLSQNDFGIPSFTLSGGGLFEGTGEETLGNFKWEYCEGKKGEEGYCNITFDEPADLSDMYWMNLDIKTNLKEYPLKDNGDAGDSRIIWISTQLIVEDANGDIDDDLFFNTHLYDTGRNLGDWESFELSFQFDYGVSTLDYSRINKISIVIRRWILSGHDEEDVPLNPGDYVLLDNIYFTDYTNKGFIKNNGNLDPSVCIGRACVDSAEDIKNFVGKTIRYMDSSLPNDEFLGNVMLVDSDTQTDQGKNKLNQIKTEFLDFAEYDSEKYYNRDSDARQSIFKGDNTNLLLYTGHGLWNGYEMGIFNSDIDKFENNNPFFEYSTGCSVGAFDKDDCYAEHLTVKTPNGAFAGIWHTRISWSGYYDAFDYFWKAVCKWDYTIGEAHQYQIKSLGGSGKFTHTLFGDPAVNLIQPTDNKPPLIPTVPEGDIEIKTGKEYGYTTTTTDPDGDLIKYGWDWDGDNVVDEWTILYSSGIDCTAVHEWSKEDIIEVRVKAKDEHGMQSDWSEPLEVNITKGKFKTKNLAFSFIKDFFENIFDTLIFIQRL